MICAYSLLLNRTYYLLLRYFIPKCKDTTFFELTIDNRELTMIFFGFFSLLSAKKIKIIREIVYLPLLLYLRNCKNQNTMCKDTLFIGQPIFTQLLFYIKGSKIDKIARTRHADRYVKKFSTRQHLIIMLFSSFEGYNSLREVVLGMLSNAHKLVHLGLDYMICRSTLSDANRRRTSAVFGEIYLSVYSRNHKSLSDSSLSHKDLKRLYAMDSTTISLFNELLKGCGRNPISGKKKIYGLCRV